MKESKYNRDVLEPLVQKSFSIAGVLKSLGLKLSGGNYRNISARIDLYQISTDHFTGAAWRNSLTEEEQHTRHRLRVEQLVAEGLFCENSTRHVRVKQLILLGWVYECSICHIDSWQGKPITIQIDHINGKHTDNRLNNLRFLCPNCHQQTETWGNKSGRVLDYRNF